MNQYRHLWEKSQAPLGRVIAHALIWGSVSFLILFVLLFSIKLFRLGLDPNSAAPDFWNLSQRYAFWATIGAVGIFLLSIFSSSRPLQDIAFRWAGFAATFFGLAMLVVFFSLLGVEVYRWFQITPQLVEKANDKMRKDQKEMQEKPKKFVQDGLDALLLEMKAEIDKLPTAEEKKEVKELFENDIIPQKKKELEITAKEMKLVAFEGVRSNPTKVESFVHFVSKGPSSEPWESGILPAILGSLYLGLITILFAVPVGVGAAIYLEEYKQKGWLGSIIQVNINNLAGIPSVVYGILGAYIFVELIFKNLEGEYSLWGQPENSFFISARNVLGGGLTLGLLTLPIVIVSTQEALRAVPQSIRQGAYALGATQWQTIWGIVLPVASPGILTGTILSLSRAIGEAAPLVLFGATLFASENPGPFSRFTIIPMQIFSWADRPPVMVDGERIDIWKFNAALASVILLAMLLSLNAFAIYFRNRTQRKMRT